MVLDLDREIQNGTERSRTEQRLEERIRIAKRCSGRDLVLNLDREWSRTEQRLEERYGAQKE